MKQDIVTEQRVFDEIKKAIVKSLGVEEESIKPESFLVKDLNAELQIRADIWIQDGPLFYPGAYGRHVWRGLSN